VLKPSKLATVNGVSKFLLHLKMLHGEKVLISGHLNVYIPDILLLDHIRHFKFGKKTPDKKE
jgi:hypothetical protein